MFVALIVFVAIAVAAMVASVRSSRLQVHPDVLTIFRKAYTYSWTPSRLVWVN